MAKQAAGSAARAVRRHHGARGRHGERQRRARSTSSRSSSSTARRPTPPARSRAATSSAKAARATPRSSSARIIDRSIRPLFPEGFKNEVQVFIYVISADQENAPTCSRCVAASCALNASKIPFTTPVAARSRRPHSGQVGAQPDVPAARVQRHGARRRRLGGLDHHGRRRRARGHRRGRRRGAHRRAEGHPRADRRAGRAAQADGSERPTKMEWTKAEIADDAHRQA